MISSTGRDMPLACNGCESTMAELGKGCFFPFDYMPKACPYRWTISYRCTIRVPVDDIIPVHHPCSGGWNHTGAPSVSRWMISYRCTIRVSVDDFMFLHIPLLCIREKTVLCPIWNITLDIIGNVLVFLVVTNSMVVISRLPSKIRVITFCKF